VLGPGVCVCVCAVSQPIRIREVLFAELIFRKIGWKSCAAALPPPTQEKPFSDKHIFILGNDDLYHPQVVFSNTL
jgi:hypothetical protein